MTEDELLAQIQETDSGAYIRDINGQRVLVTSSLESNTIVYVNPANMHIIHMDPIEWDIQPGDVPVTIRIMSIDEIKERYGLG